MKPLYDKLNLLLNGTSLDFKRYLLPRIDWTDRMFGIVGPRGVGKTTMILQHFKENHSVEDSLYVSMDDVYFSNHPLHEVADEFYKNGGRYLFIDEIHKYPLWSRTLKNLYDSYPDMKIVFSGSSVLDILKGWADLSRRALVTNLQGLSFREYLQFFHGISVPVLSLEEILARKSNDLKQTIGSPLKYFKDYLQKGYYPFANAKNFLERLNGAIVQTMENDIPAYSNMNVATGRKLLKLLMLIAQNVPYKPNFNSLSKSVEVSRNNIVDYFHFIERAGMIAQLLKC